MRQEELHLIEGYEGNGLVVAGSARRIVNALEIFESSLERFAGSRSAAAIAFRRIKNFACVEVHPQSKKLLVYLMVRS